MSAQKPGHTHVFSRFFSFVLSVAPAPSLQMVRQTTRNETNVLQTLAGMVEAFDTNYIVGVREEPRLTEQQFGNFQNLATIVNSKAERARFGRFYYRYYTFYSIIKENGVFWEVLLWILRYNR